MREEHKGLLKDLAAALAADKPLDDVLNSYGHKPAAKPTPQPAKPGSPPIAPGTDSADAAALEAGKKLMAVKAAGGFRSLVLKYCGL